MSCAVACGVHDARCRSVCGCSCWTVKLSCPCICVCRVASSGCCAPGAVRQLSHVICFNARMCERSASACGGGASGDPRFVAFIGPAKEPYNFVAPPWARLGEGCADGCDGDPGPAVRAGYFSCVWFLCLGRLHGPVTEDLWGGASAGVAPLAGGGSLLARTVELLPEVAPAPRVSPAERRWRKKQRKGGD